MGTIGTDHTSEATPRHFLTSIPLVVFVSFVYMAGVVALCRASLLFEAAISLGLPVFCYLAGWFRYKNPRLMQLLMIESFFNLLAVSARLSVAEGWDTVNAVCSWGFVGFFAIQVLGFVAFQVKRRNWHGMLQSSTAVVLLIAWWLSIEDHTNVVDAESRFLMWGEDAPLAIQLYYVTWVINVAFAEALALPWLRLPVAHMVSVAISMASGEFFHIRLLTACNLFVIDLVTGFGMQKPEGLGREFAVIPVDWLDGFWNRFRPALAWVASAGCLAILIGAYFWGLDLQP